MTPGATAETVDGMSLAKIDAIIEPLRFERYRWTPVRRTYIPKANGEAAAARPPHLVGQAAAGGASASSWRPTTSRSSPTTRTASGPAAGCHTALREVYHTWHGTRLVHRGGHRPVLRQPGPRGPAGDPGREDPRRPLPAADREPAQGRVPGGLDGQRHAQRHAAGRGGQSRPLEHLPRPVGPVRRDRRSSRTTTAGPGGKPNPAYERLRHRAGTSDGRADRRRRAALRQAGAAAALRSTRPTRTTGGCATCATPTTSCSGSSGRAPKPRRSSGASGSSCATRSSWNSPRRRP